MNIKLKKMKTTKELACIATMFLALFGYGCKKIKPSPPVQEPPKTEEPENKPEEPGKNVFVPIKFESANLTLDIQYLENSYLIRELSFSGGISYVLTYNNQILKKLERYTNGKKDYFVDYLIANNLITRASRFESVPSRDTPMGKYLMDHDAAGQITVIRNYAVSNALTQTRTLNYGTEGRLVTIKTEGTENNTYTCSYDDKKGVFSGVKFVQLLQMELEYNFLTFGTNNLSTLRGSSSLRDLDYNYSYNANSYPEDLNVKSGNETQHYRISYKEIK